MAKRHREFFIFAATFFAFAYFHQGGGWNQNSRFAEVRAMVEEHRFAIDSFLIYDGNEGSEHLTRTSINNGDFVLGGKTQRIAWTGSEGNLVPINGVEADESVTLVGYESALASGDIGFARGHFHPNKPPGASFAAVPGYLLLYSIEKALGVDLDNWWPLTCNAWLTSVFSMALISALGCVIFFRVTTLLVPDSPQVAAATTAVFAFGTMFFSYGTMLFDHNLTATALLASFYLLARDRPPNSIDASRAIFFSGLFAGVASITNYVAAVIAIFLAVFLVSRRSFRSVVPFALGLLGPFLLICFYNVRCFGTPFALNTDYQNPVFHEAAFLGMFGVPRLDVGVALLLSPFRGLFFTSPVLVLGVFGLVRMLRTSEWKAEAWLCIATFAFFFLINICFNGWHGGFSGQPRYLLPALPFIAIPMAFGFRRWPMIAMLFATFSLFVNFVLTAVDAESPLGTGYLARVENRSLWTYNPMTEYAAPLFFTGRAWPILNAILEEHLAAEPKGDDPAADDAQLAEERADLREGIARGDEDPFLLATFTGPVSVNPIGVYEGSFYRIFAAHTTQTDWNSFNAGEFIFP
ncbi:MAG: hypothetical protein M3O82_09675, partial [Verrucomicrobiota bacterium]|nr:hypothetical protein [Verrucomicrobiota bacterium]